MTYSYRSPGVELRPMPLPPAGFDPLTANHDTLVGYGLPHRPIHPGQRSLWERVLSEPIVWLKPSVEQAVGGHRGSGRVNLDDPATWCGAIAATGQYKNISAVWTVPPFIEHDPHFAGPFYCSCWVGLDDGAFAGNLWQAGTMNVTDPNGTGTQEDQSAFFWWEIYYAQNETFTTPEPTWVTIPVPLEPGQQVAVAVDLDPPALGETTTTGSVWVVNLSTRRGSILPMSGLPAFDAVEADWIVERITIDTAHDGPVHQQLPNFIELTMNDCGVGLADKSGVVNLTKAEAVDMSSDDGSRPLALAEITGPMSVRCIWHGFQ